MTVTSPADPDTTTSEATAPARPAWTRPAVGLLLAATAVLYLWGLGASGWANAFYSAAVQAGATSWKAFFYGSSDASSFITVDKPPASLWVMDLSARVFGVNAWSILVPQALEGVAAVGMLYLAVRRWFGPIAGLVAGAALAVTPVAVLMFRFNNPDALLVLLMITAAYAVTRALERASLRWLAAAGALIGLAFLTKSLQALLVVPGFALAYLVAAPTSPLRRIGHLLAAGAALLVAAGWWVAIVSLVPAADRPYIGGSQHNSELELIFGYNGFGRLTGDETGSVTPGGVSQWGATGWTRLFGSEFGGQAVWLLPAALLAIVVGVWLSGRAPRTDRARAAVLLWGGWLLVTFLTFSFMKGIFHPYYLVALAPAMAALVAIVGTLAWRRRSEPLVGAAMAVAVGLTTWTAAVMLDRTSGWHPWLSAAIILAGTVTAVALLGVARLPLRLAAGIAVAALVVALAGPAAYALDTASTAHTGSIPSAGPSVAGGFGGGGFGGFRGGFGGGPAQGFPGRGTGNTGTGAFPGAGGGFPGGGGLRSGGGFPGGGLRGGGFPGGGFPGGGGGLLDASTPSTALTAALRANAGGYRWVAAAIGSQNASGYQLASGKPVMAIGGFNGSDAAPTLEQFQAYVAAGDIHYFIGGGAGGRSNGGSSDSEAIASWVAAHYTAQTIGGVSVYDLTSGATS
jgi:4-amino-4-deoxy-L-arabinose transferase-like glycosyltransferase